MESSEFEKKIDLVMNDVEELLRIADEKQKKVLSRLAVEILRLTLSE